MSNASQGPGWWQASDGRWYAPEQHPDYKPQPPPPPSAAPAPPPPNPPSTVPAPPLPNPPAAPAPSPPSGAQAPPAPNAWSGAQAPPPPRPPSPGVSIPPAGAAQAPQGFVAPPRPNSPSFSFDVKRWSREQLVTGVATIVLFLSLFLPWYTYNLGFTSISADGLWHGWMYLVLLVCLAIFAFLILRAGFAEMPVKLPLTDELVLLIATGFNLLLTLLAFFLKPGGIGFNGVGWGFGAFFGVVAAIAAVVSVGVPVINSM
jgi:hypothetical protein